MKDELEEMLESLKNRPRTRPHWTERTANDLLAMLEGFGMLPPAKEGNVQIEEDKDTAYPLVDKECPKCGNKKAYFWEIQTRASDEPATQFFKCEKCKHTWRHYD